MSLRYFATRNACGIGQTLGHTAMQFVKPRFLRLLPVVVNSCMFECTMKLSFWLYSTVTVRGNLRSFCLCCLIIQQNDHSRATGVETALLLDWKYLLQAFLVCSMPTTVLCPTEESPSCVSGSFTVATRAVRQGEEKEAFFMCLAFLCRAMSNTQSILDCCWQHLDVALTWNLLAQGANPTPEASGYTHHTVYFKLLLTALACSIFWCIDICLLRGLSQNQRLPNKVAWEGPLYGTLLVRQPLSWKSKQTSRKVPRQNGINNFLAMVDGDW